MHPHLLLQNIWKGDQRLIFVRIITLHIISIIRVFVLLYKRTCIFYRCIHQTSKFRRAFTFSFKSVFYIVVKFWHLTGSFTLVCRRYSFLCCFSFSSLFWQVFESQLLCFCKLCWTRCKFFVASFLLDSISMLLKSSVSLIYLCIVVPDQRRCY